jgi:hypothetical protein
MMVSSGFDFYFGGLSRHCEERSDEAIQSSCTAFWIAWRSPSSGAHSRDPLAGNDGLKFTP